MMKFLAGAAFMAMVFCFWILTRLVPQNQDYSDAIYKCRADKSRIAVEMHKVSNLLRGLK